VDDRGIRAILKEVNNEELTVALKPCPSHGQQDPGQPVRTRVAMIKEDLEVMGRSGWPTWKRPSSRFCGWPRSWKPKVG
jgi:hypothetical protein